MDSLQGIESFFTPKSIAVAGASSDPAGVGSIIFTNLNKNAELGLLKASVYAVNPRHARIGARPCYPNLHSLPETPELLVIAVPVAATPALVREAAAEGVKAIIIIGSGFGEAGRTDLEAEIAKRAAEHGVRVLGPNTIGLLDTYSGVDTLFLPFKKRLPSGEEVTSLLRPLRGGVVIVTQSGHLGEMIAEELCAHQVGVRAIVGVGNQVDVAVEDVFDHFADDAHTKVVAVYLEGVKNGRRFLEKASNAAARKPIVVLKMGKTPAGAKAALTHTASMVGDYQTAQAAFRQAGLIEAETFEELVDYCVAFSMLPEARGPRILIVTNAGGTGAIAADESVRVGLSVEPLSGRTLQSLKATFGKASFAEIVSFSNPLDLSAAATTNEFAGVCNILAPSPDYDVMVIVPTHQPPKINYDVVNQIARVAAKAGKPICVCTMGTSDLAKKLHHGFLERGIPSYPTPERAVRALRALVEYRNLKAKVRPPVAVFETDRVRWLGEHRGLLMEPKSSELLAIYGIPCAKSLVLFSEKDGGAVRGRISYPVACKLLSKRLPHKTGKGGVILNVGGVLQLRSAFRELRQKAKNLDLPFDGVLVQEMIKGGVELILGAVSDKTFGPTVTFGMGGVYTELLRDYATAIAPVDREEALRMVESIKMRPLLEGYRNGIKVAKQQLADLISSFSQIMVENPSIEEMEINPLTALPDRNVAVDVRISLKGRL